MKFLMLNYYVVPLSLNVIVIVLGSISFILSILTLWTLWKMRKSLNMDGLKKSTKIMLGNLISADALRSLFYLIGMVRYLIIYYAPFGPNRQSPCVVDYFCTIQSFFSIWFNSITIISMLMIGIFAVHQIQQNSDQESTFHHSEINTNFLIQSTAVCWLLPFAFSLIPAFFGVLGEDQSSTTSGWCWISSCTNTTSIPMRITFMTLYSRGLELTIFIVNLALYLFLRFLIHQHHHENPTNLPGMSMSPANSIFGPINCTLRNDSKLLILTTLSVLLIRIWGIARMIIEICIITNLYSNSFIGYMHKTNNILLYFQGISDGLEGTAIAIVLLICSKSSREIFLHIVCAKPLGLLNRIN